MTSDKRIIGAALRAERKAQGLVVSDLAARFREVAPPHVRLPDREHVETTIRGHERGAHSVSERYKLLYCLALGKPEEELFPSTPQAPSAAGTVDQSPTPGQGDDDVKRRAALQLLAAIGTGASVPPGVLEELLSGVDHVLGRTADVEEWEQTVRDYGHQIYRRPFDALIPDLIADIVAVGELLKKGRPPREQAGLLRVSAGLTGVLAETLCNVGEDRAARRTWSTARRAADASGDRELRVWVRGRAAQHVSWAGNSHHAVMTMVDDAAHIANGTPFSGLARGYAAGAYQAASQGDNVTAHKSLDMLKRTFEQLPRSSSEPTVLDFQESQLLWSEAYVRTISGDRRAVTAVENARALYPSTARVPITNLDLMRAIDLVKSGEVREGLDLAVTSLTDRPRPVLATRQLVGQVLSTLPEPARTLPAARDLRALSVGA
ncbi:XRE family transcriptional regulator [Actinomadura rugatobispora]|uniref:XRE family transcriptional regulator n=1 Tax=Actinomadura rugatobispora TaxID=1994 RepID=A0ABW0ZYA9_9ACTN|nr:hypothetical protein GCM10010200_040890 [Actinomadura rugatobispora]